MATTTGDVYHQLTALHQDPENGRRWVFRCSCGLEKSIDRYSVAKGLVKSCGCFRASPHGRTSVQAGSRFGKLSTLHPTTRNRNGHIKWLCRCDCGAESEVFGTHLVRGTTTSCGCDRVRHGSRHVQWAGHGEISGEYFSQIRRSAEGLKGRRTVVPFNVTLELLWELFLDQDRRCALTRIPLVFRQRTHDEPQTASLDRIDSSKGYVDGNVQWLHKDVNKMKGSFDQTHFITMCKLISGGSCEIDYDKMAMEMGKIDEEPETLNGFQAVNIPSLFGDTNAEAK